TPALAVAGAHADMLRVAELIARGGDGLAGISVTLDSHHRIDIAHPASWMPPGHGAVAPFTQTTAADVRAGSYQPRAADALARALAYLDALEAAGRYTLMVWPTHCEIGSWGQNVHAAVRAAYNGWEERTLRTVHKVDKGSNPWTEHYSAIEADVPDPLDPGTQVNQALLGRLAGAERLYITGEAGSHCVKATTEHIVAHWDPRQLARLVIVTDCMSPVGGFEAQHDAFIAAMAARGLRTATAAEVLAELLDNATITLDR
ncbi:MAG: cysteine hydrolase, partial [Caulobacter sp.]|nr:cysteine hydrolase [Vitreoscilla sp.]